MDGCRKMQVILMSSVKKLGNAGSVVSVRNGFGRYLVQSGAALRASSQNLEQIEHQRETLAQRQASLVIALNKIVASIANRTFTFIKTAGSDGRLFGSVNKREIALAMLKFLKSAAEVQEVEFDLNHSHVNLVSPIKDLGCSKVKISLHPEVEDFFVVVNVATSEDLAAIALKKFLNEESKQESV
jgi:large subunit ribosomal protein L9